VLKPTAVSPSCHGSAAVSLPLQAYRHPTMAPPRHCLACSEDVLRGHFCPGAREQSADALRIELGLLQQIGFRGQPGALPATHPSAEEVGIEPDLSASRFSKPA